MNSVSATLPWNVFPHSDIKVLWVSAISGTSFLVHRMWLASFWKAHKGRAKTEWWYNISIAQTESKECCSDSLLIFRTQIKNEIGRLVWYTVSKHMGLDDFWRQTCSFKRIIHFSRTRRFTATCCIILEITHPKLSFWYLYWKQKMTLIRSVLNICTPVQHPVD